METGIDKLHLTTKAFTIKEFNTATFGIKAGTHQGGVEGEMPLLFTDGKGRKVRGEKVYHNSKHGIGNYTIDERGLLVSLNPSKVSDPLNPIRLVGLHSEGYRKAISLWQDEMRHIGIQVDIEQMTLTRVDIAKQSQMNLPCHQYDPAFRMMKGVRTKERQYEGGYLFHNTNHECLFYDKQKELIHAHLDALLPKGQRNLMRAEVRAKKSKPVASMFHAGTLGRLHELSNDDIIRDYNTYIIGKVFGKLKEPTQAVMDFQKEIEVLRYYRDSHGRKGWLHYLTFEGLDDRLQAIGGIDRFLQMLSEIGYSRSQTNKIKHELRQMMQSKAKADKMRHRVTPSMLMDELRERFAA